MVKFNPTPHKLETDFVEHPSGNVDFGQLLAPFYQEFVLTGSANNDCLIAGDLLTMKSFVSALKSYKKRFFSLPEPIHRIQINVKSILPAALFGVNEIEDNNTECVLLLQIVGTVITYYGCIKHKNGPNIVFEVSKIKISSSMQDLPGFIMQLDDLKKLSNFYNRYCVKKSNTTSNIKRKPSTTIVDLDKIINTHKP
ncbi:hypothetical protein INT47_012121 [Mucor saturninus]|uniref:Uncharacterized protein n=1 Tax=Mucor saturninus TaxID=64648 RepID=A0A8H7QQL7_9FUNG|nr:hypothetical protein INT47_012121 [Mucor saturninus]